MDQNTLTLMMQMARMGMTPDNLLRLNEQMSGAMPSQHDRPPAFDLSLGPEELEERIEQYKDWLERDRKLGPTPGPRQEPGTLLYQHNTGRRRWAENQSQTDNEGCARMTIVGFEKHSSTTPLDHLQRVPLSGMLLRKVHRGKYFLCRSISLPMRSVSAHIIVQDPDGDAVGLAIYNFPTAFDCSDKYLDILFPLGTIFAIREPTYKPATQGPFPIVRVDSPTDVVLIDPQDEMLKGIRWKDISQVPKPLSVPTTADSWKLHGNSLFKTEKWLPAAIAYSHGLKLSPDSVPLRLNRSETYLRLGYFSCALHDAKHVLNVIAVDHDQRLKALYRAGRAEYGRGNFVQAKELFNSCRALNPKDKNPADWDTRCEKRLEETRGNYDWVELFKVSQTNLHPDVGEYRGPIDVQSLQHRGGGRGIVASKSIAVGELLLVCKPFVSVFVGDLKGNDTVLTIDLLGKRIEKSAQSAIRSYVAQKLCGNPDLYHSVFDLYAGPGFPMPPSSYSPAPSEDVTCGDVLSSGINIDIARLDAICTYNAFGPVPLAQISTSISPHEEKQASALYLLPSLFNHSCAGNARYITIGDIMVIRATRSISIGEEITLRYRGGLTHSERAQNLRQYLPSGCDCWLCQEDLKDGKAALQRRHDLMSDLSYARRRSLSLSAIRTLKSAVNATYATSRGVVRPELALLQHEESVKLKTHLSQSVIKQAMKADIQSLISTGFVVSDDPDKPLSGRKRERDGNLPIATSSIPTIDLVEPLYIMIALSQGYYAMQQREKAVRWLRAAQWFTSMVVGGSKEFFLFLVAPLLRATGFFEFTQEVL